MDYRETIKFLYLIPMIFTLAWIILTPIIGYFAGWKRSLYWGIGNISFSLIGWGIYALAGGAIATMLSSLVQSFVGNVASQEAMRPIIDALTAPIFYIIILFAGNSILLTLYALVFKKHILKIKSKKQKIELYGAEYKKIIKRKTTLSKRVSLNVLSSAIAFSLFLPINVNLSQSVYAFTISDENRIKDGGINNDLFNFTRSIADILPSNYWYNPTETVDGFIASLELFGDGTIATNKLNTLFTNMHTFYQDLSTALSTEQPNNVPTDNINQLVNNFNSQIDLNDVHKFNTAFGSEPCLDTIINIIDETKDINQIFNVANDDEASQIIQMDVIITQWYNDHPDVNTINVISLNEKSYNKMEKEFSQKFFVIESQISDQNKIDLQRVIENIFAMFFNQI